MFFDNLKKLGRSTSKKFFVGNDSILFENNCGIRSMMSTLNLGLQEMATAIH